MRDRKPKEIRIVDIFSILAILISCITLVNLYFINRSEIDDKQYVICEDREGVKYKYKIYGDMEPKQVCESLNKVY